MNFRKTSVFGLWDDNGSYSTFRCTNINNVLFCLIKIRKIKEKAKSLNFYHTNEGSKFGILRTFETTKWVLV